jgi:methyl-accepting chemotaxis protein
MKLSTKLLILVATALIGVASVVATALHSLNTSLIESRPGQIVNLLMKAEHLVQYYQGLESSGQLTREQAQGAAKQALSQLNTDKKSYFWATDMNSINLVRPNASLVGTKTSGNRTSRGITDTEAYNQGLANSHVALVDVLIKRAQDAPLETKLQGVVAIPQRGWWIGTGFFYDDINATFWKLATPLLAVSLAIFAAVGALAFVMARSVRRELGGEPADAASFAAQIAEGNLDVDVKLAPSDRSSLLFVMSQMKAKLRALVSDIQQSSESIASGSCGITQGNTDLSQRTEEQAAALQETAASMEQLTSTVKQNADNARHASELAQLESQACNRLAA